MEIILQEKVPNLGTVGDKVKVKAGYARNFLLPYGKAIRATAENMADFEKRRAEFEAKAKAVLDDAKARAEKLASLQLKVAANASEEGKLFGSVGPRDIAEAVVAQGIELHKSEVHLPEGPIREVGEYDIDLQLHSDVTATIKIEVIAE